MGLSKYNTRLLFLFIITLLFSLTSCTERYEFRLKKNTYIKNWLLCGPFPNCENCSQTDYKHDERCKGFYTDFLDSIGGENYTTPQAGMKVEIPGKNLCREWFTYHSNTDKIRLNKIMKPKDMVISYAFSQVLSPKKEKIILSLGSNDGAMAFLNGKKVHECHPNNGRWLQADDDFIPVELQKGTNNLMIKIDQGTGDYGFMARFLDYDSVLAQLRENIDQHKILSLVSIENTLSARFGSDYKISVLNPPGKATIELRHEKKGKLDSNEFCLYYCDR